MHTRAGTAKGLVLTEHLSMEERSLSLSIPLGQEFKCRVWALFRHLEEDILNFVYIWRTVVWEDEMESELIIFISCFVNVSDYAICLSGR